MCVEYIRMCRSVHTLREAEVDLRCRSLSSPLFSVERQENLALTDGLDWLASRHGPELELQTWVSMGFGVYTEVLTLAH